MVASSKQDRWEIFKTIGTYAKCEEISCVRAVNLKTEKVVIDLILNKRVT